ELRGVSRGDRPAGLEGRLQLREGLEARFPRRLVLADHIDRALPAGDLDRDDLRVERALALRAERLVVRRKREAVLIGAAETALGRDELSAQAHVAVTVGVHEPIGEVLVLHRVLAKREAG